MYGDHIGTLKRLGCTVLYSVKGTLGVEKGLRDLVYGDHIGTPNGLGCTVLYSVKGTLGAEKGLRDLVVWEVWEGFGGWLYSTEGA